jgi:hypothetical protein
MAADAEPLQPAGLVQWLVQQNGYPDLASKLTDEQAVRLVQAWPRHAGRPRRGQVASWDTISGILVDLELGGCVFLHKEWKAFQRRMGVGTPGATRAASAQRVRSKK